MLRKYNKPNTNQELFLEVLHDNPTKEEKSSQETREELLKEYQALLKRTNRIKKKAYLVTFKNLKDLIYIAFPEFEVDGRSKAMWEAVKYFESSFHPVFLSENMLYQAHAVREPRLDKYAEEGKVPVITLMEVLGATFSCGACGKGKFDKESYEFRRCYVTEEFDMYPFTKGMLLCKKCFDKYMGYNT